MITEAIAKAVGGQDLSESEMVAAMQEIMEGRATGAQIGGFLVALRIKGETVEEVSGAAKVMRQKVTPIPLSVSGDDLVDTCGTGGDGAGTFNVSTTAAFVAAGAGLKVAKHGNRSVSSKCGSADLIEALGISLALTPEQVGRCIEEVGIGFLFAPGLHPAMKHAIGPRKELKLRTVFNLLGPLTNPAGAGVQLIGVYDRALVEPLAQVLGRLGSRSAFVVHGADGLDELSISGMTHVARLQGGKVESFSLSPADVGLKTAPLAEIAGGDAAQNLEITLGILKGENGAKRDMVLLNSAAALAAAGKAEDLHAGVELAAQSIDSGAALAKLEDLRGLSQSLAEQN